MVEFIGRCCVCGRLARRGGTFRKHARQCRARDTRQGERAPHCFQAQIWVQDACLHLLITTGGQDRVLFKWRIIESLEQCCWTCSPVKLINVGRATLIGKWRAHWESNVVLWMFLLICSYVVKHSFIPVTSCRLVFHWSLYHQVDIARRQLKNGVPS